MIPTISGIEYCQVDRSVTNLIGIYERRRREGVAINLANKLTPKFKQHLKERLEIFFAMLKREAKVGDPWWKAWALQQKQQALFKQIARADWIITHAIDTDAEQMLMAQILKPFYESAGEAGADRAVKTLEAFMGRDIVFKGAQSWIKDNAIRFGKKYSKLITKNTNKMIRDEIALSIKEGGSLSKLMLQIKGKVLGPNQIYRAEMVGRTEMARSYNMSRLLQDSSMGIKDYTWDGCNPDCEICSEWLAGNPYKAEGIEYIIGSTHPNCAGGQNPIIANDFVPNENVAMFA